ncbi:hypothetical protein Lser_V15G34232 [Lactuca serriola]
MKTRGFYQKEDSVQERKMDFEDMLTRFAATSEKRLNETDLGQLALHINERALGGLPSNTKKNPRGAQINIVTTRSGNIIIPPTPIHNEDPKEVHEKEKENPHSQIVEATRRVQDLNSTSPRSEQKNTPSLKPYQPPLPFPGGARQDKPNEEYQKFLEHIKALQINIPFIEVVAQMPKYAKFLKELLTNRKKMEEVYKVALNENCSAAMLNKLPKKMGDPGMLTFPCQFGNLATSYALVDSG